MAIFNSYVKLPEGNARRRPRKRRCSRPRAEAQDATGAGTQCLVGWFGNSGFEKPMNHHKPP